MGVLRNDVVVLLRDGDPLGNLLFGSGRREGGISEGRATVE